MLQCQFQTFPHAVGIPGSTSPHPFHLYRYKLAQLQMSLFHKCQPWSRFPTPQGRLHCVETKREKKRNYSDRNVPFNQLLTRPHFLEQRRVANDSSRVLDLAACLVQARDDADYRALHHVRQIRDAVERHAAGPLIHHLDHAEPRLADKVIGVVCRQDDLVERLDLVDLLGYLDYLGDTALKACGESGLDVSLLLEDECGKEGDYFLWLVLG